MTFMKEQNSFYNDDKWFSTISIKPRQKHSLLKRCTKKQNLHHRERKLHNSTKKSKLIPNQSSLRPTPPIDSSLAEPSQNDKLIRILYPEFCEFGEIQLVELIAGKSLWIESLEEKVKRLKQATRNLLWWESTKVFLDLVHRTKKVGPLDQDKDKIFLSFHYLISCTTSYSLAPWNQR